MRFNTNVNRSNVTTNVAGGSAYKQSPELELVSLLLTSFVQKDCYTGENYTVKRIKELLDVVDPVFAGQAAVFARTHYGMRTVSHIVAGELCARAKGQSWLKDFLNAVVYRPDDILEIASYYNVRANKITHGMRKGFAKALVDFTGYQLAKYRGGKKALSLMDIANISHPKSNESLTALMKGELKNVDTWEARLSEAGQDKEDEAALEAAKSGAWESLLTENKLGYFALLRNIRNIVKNSYGVSVETGDRVCKILCEKLIDEKQIKNSKIFPFRYMTAMEELTDLWHSKAKGVMIALSQALEISVNNCPELKGSTLIAVDASGSMQGRYYQVASVFASAVLKRNPLSDVMLFSTRAKMLNLNPSDSVSTLTATLRSEFLNGGTDFNCIFQTLSGLKKKYDRIILFSDMQSWAHGLSPSNSSYRSYCREMGIDPFFYSVDLAGKGTMQIPERNVCTLAGFSDKIFDLFNKIEVDKSALITQIKEIAFVSYRKVKFND